MKISKINLAQIVANKPSQKKITYPANTALKQYLKLYGRMVNLPLEYNDLVHFAYSRPTKDANGEYTQWDTLSYDLYQWDFIRKSLVIIYAQLKTEGNLTFINQLEVERVEYCGFGNSNPFRIRIKNKFNDNYDHFYIKKADASRIYGLELEHILSPNRLTYLYDRNTLIEEHIPGIPGDIFINHYLNKEEINHVRLAKEFVRFNERCYMRLLGDMRSYNYVVVMTPDVENYQYRLRAIDFDQQSYEGKKMLYAPQYFKENIPMIENVMNMLNTESIMQYQAEERTSIAFRIAASRYRIKMLMDIMSEDEISKPEKVELLKNELYETYGLAQYKNCTTMGQILKIHMKFKLQSNLIYVPKMRGK